MELVWWSYLLRLFAPGEHIHISADISYNAEKFSWISFSGVLIYFSYLDKLA